VVTARLIKPSSDLAAWRWIKEQSALSEMLDLQTDELGKDSIYEIADRLLLHKENIEKALYSKEREIFFSGNEDSVYLYDLTNTYFEGQCKNNELTHRGKSKEKRNDCLQVTLALVVDRNGFPVFSQIYKGGQSEPETLANILDRIEKDMPPLLPKPTMIMDRGIATEDNINLLKSREYPYTIIKRRATEKDYEKEFANIKDLCKKVEDPAQSEETVYVKGLDTDDKDIYSVLCYSRKKEQKEEAMDTLKEKRFLEEITKLNHSIETGYVKRIDKVAQRIGRIKERYSSIAQYYNIEQENDEKQEYTMTIRFTKKESRQRRSTITGCYVIETTHKDLTAEGVWKLYMTLSKVEAAFRSLKSELGLRPVRHQLSKRTESHLFISVLAYHMLITIEHQLRNQKDHRRWDTIRDILSTHQRNTVVLTDEIGKVYHVRVSGMPEKSNQEIYKLLHVKDPLKRQISYIATRV